MNVLQLTRHVPATDQCSPSFLKLLLLGRVDKHVCVFVCPWGYNCTMVTFDLNCHMLIPYAHQGHCTARLHKISMWLHFHRYYERVWPCNKHVVSACQKKHSIGDTMLVIQNNLYMLLRYNAKKLMKYARGFTTCSPVDICENFAKCP